MTQKKNSTKNLIKYLSSDQIIDVNEIDKKYKQDFWSNFLVNTLFIIAGFASVFAASKSLYSTTESTVRTAHVIDRQINDDNIIELSSHPLSYESWSSCQLLESISEHMWNIWEDPYYVIPFDEVSQDLNNVHKKFQILLSKSEPGQSTFQLKSFQNYLDELNALVYDNLHLNRTDFESFIGQSLAKLFYNDGQFVTKIQNMSSSEETEQFKNLYLQPPENEAHWPQKQKKLAKEMLYFFNLLENNAHALQFNLEEDEENIKFILKDLLNHTAVQISNQLSDYKPFLSFDQFVDIHVDLLYKQALRAYDQQVAQSEQVASEQVAQSEQVASEQGAQNSERKWAKRIQRVAFYSLSLGVSAVLGYRIFI